MTLDQLIFKVFLVYKILLYYIIKVYIKVYPSALKVFTVLFELFIKKPKFSNIIIISK